MEATTLKPIETSQEYLQMSAAVAKESVTYITSQGLARGYTVTNFSDRGVHLVAIAGDMPYCSTLLAALEIAHQHFSTEEK